MVAAQPAMRACSACAGDYEDPEREPDQAAAEDEGEAGADSVDDTGERVPVRER